MKKTGILFPISALPSVYGVGDFGQNAYQFIDKIADRPGWCVCRSE